MAKRRAEDILIRESPSKRSRAPLPSCVDTPLTNVVPPPSLLALLDSRCGKRPRCFTDMEKQEGTTLYPKPPLCEATNRAASALTVPTLGSFQKRHSSSYAASNGTKRPRMDPETETITPQIASEDGGVTDTEDSSFNSFQFWRVPLPELDLSLLEDAKEDIKTKEKSKFRDSAVSSDAMEN